MMQKNKICGIMVSTEEIVLYLFFDTNLFKRKELKSLDDYDFSSVAEKIIKYVNTSKIKDVVFCVDQTAFFEYVKQIEKWYKEEVVERFAYISSIIKKDYPLTTFVFRNEKDFADEYCNGLMESLKQKNIKLIKTIPDSQTNGMRIRDVFEKTINQVIPFDKKRNKNIKDAFISETINSEAKRDGLNDYMLITTNYNDFKDNSTYKNFKIESVKNDNKDKVLDILNIIKQSGYNVLEDVIADEFLYSNKVVEDIKNMIEKSVSMPDYYKEVPIIKKKDDKIVLKYENDEGFHNVKFILIDEDVEYECLISYKFINRQIKLKNRYITYSDESGELMQVEV